MKLICLLFGHRAKWVMNRTSGMFFPQCDRCKQHIASSVQGHLDPFYL